MYRTRKLKNDATLAIIAGEAGFPALRRLNRQQQQQVEARNVTFQKILKFRKFSENATLLSKFDNLSKLQRRVALSARQPDGVFEM